MPTPTSSRAQTPVKRLLAELQEYRNEPNEGLLHLGPVRDEDLMQWTAVMRGIDGTAYEGGRWRLSISLPPNYPIAPPTIKFVTPICHPNVNFKTGEICLDLLKDMWSAIYTVNSTLTAIRHLLTTAEPDSPLNIDIAALMRNGDALGADSLIRFYTETEKEAWDEPSR